MRVLVITDYLPYPPVAGDRLRVYNLVRRIAERAEVSLAAPLRPEDDPDAVRHLHEICYAVFTGWLPRRAPLEHLPGVLRYAAADKPPELLFQDSPELRDSVARAAIQNPFDVLHVEPSRMATYLEASAEFQRSARVLVFHNFAPQQLERQWRLEDSLVGKARSWLNWRWMRTWEPNYASRFDRCVTVSEPDRRLLLAANPNLKVDVVPNGVDTRTLQPLPEGGDPPTLLFVGTMDYAPNRDAALLLVERILPLVRRTVPEARAYIVGANPPPELERYRGNGVEVTGRVAELEPYYRAAAATVVPLRAGGGTRLKILESMAFGRPVVSTCVGCEGLDVVNGEHLLVADEVERFAEHTVRLLRNAGLRHRLAGNARRLVETKYDWDGISEGMMQVYERALETAEAERGAAPAYPGGR